jgi:putative FmdB family regulatory protein
MPIYEWDCVACDFSFEALASVAEANAPRDCPECGQPAGRIISACIIGAGARSGGDVTHASAAAAPHAGEGGHGHGHQHGRRSPIPEPARLCWMDDKSAARFAAYKTGRGHEYDDKQATVAERRKQRGEVAPVDNSYSPVKQILARKKAKEAAAKAAATSSQGASPAQSSATVAAAGTPSRPSSN